MYAVKSSRQQKALGTHFVPATLQSVPRPLCPPAAPELLYPIALPGPKPVFYSIFQLSCLVNEQLGNNNLRDSLHPLYTSNKLF